MWAFLSMCLSYLIGNKVVQAIALNTIKNIVQHGAALVPIAIAEIKSASARDDLSGVNKLGMVANKLADQFPEIAKDIGKDAIIEIAQATYVAMKNPDVPIVPEVKTVL